MRSSSGRVHFAHLRLELTRAPIWSRTTSHRLFTGFVANSKVQNSSTFQGPKLHISSTKIIDKKSYPRRRHSKFRLQRDTEVYCSVLTNTVMIKASADCSHQFVCNPPYWNSKYCFKVLVTCTETIASKLSINAKFQNLQDLNSRTFQVLSSTLSVFKHFQVPWSFYSKFKHFQGFLKHAMNPSLLWRCWLGGTEGIQPVKNWVVGC